MRVWSCWQFYLTEQGRKWIGTCKILLGCIFGCSMVGCGVGCGSKHSKTASAMLDECVACAAAVTALCCWSLALPCRPGNCTKGIKLTAARRPALRPSIGAAQASDVDRTAFADSSVPCRSGSRSSSYKITALADFIRTVFNTSQSAAPQLAPAHLGYRVHVHMEKNKAGCLLHGDAASWMLPSLYSCACTSSDRMQ